MAAYAARYARAFSQVAVASHLDVSAAQQQMQNFSATLAGSRELREVLMNPAIASDGKLRVLDAIAGRLGMLQPVRNFIAVIMDHGRLDALDEILTEYSLLADQNADMAEVEIVSARPLDERERAELEEKASGLAGARVRASFREDASLLGGAVLKIGSTVYDGSIKAQLAGMRQQLAGGV